MDILVRQRIANDSSNALLSDRALSKARICIGSAADADIQLSGADVNAYHAEVTSSGKSIRIRSQRGTRVSVNGSSGTKFDLKPGDRITLGSHVLDVLDPPTGFDLALSLDSQSSPTVAFEEAYQTTLRETTLKPRLLAWTLAAVVLAITVLVPLAYHYAARSTTDTTDVTWWLNDTVWSSGPLHEAHASLDNTCKSCHVKLFERVTNDSCNVCHENSQDHIVAVNDNGHLPIDINGRCASCHLEHNEPVSSLIIRTNDLCVDCHGEHDLQNSDTTLGRVADFGKDLHPPFTVSLLSAPEQGAFDKSDAWPVLRVPLTEASERSQLKFNHEVHYNNTQVTRNSGDPLGCDDCHTLGVDGEHFAPINFELNCSNSGCHQLELDPRNRLPHGQPDIAIAAIEGYYLRKSGNPEQPEGANKVDRRRRLDKLPDDRDACTDSAWLCAMQSASRKIEQQFTKTGCVTCHVIEDSGGDVLDRYRVAVVKLTEDYHPTARFDHVSHGVLVEPGSGNSATGDRACMSCHAAQKSVESSDLLLPDIDNCTTCHNGPQRALNAPLSCIDCHAYHPAS